MDKFEKKDREKTLRNSVISKFYEMAQSLNYEYNTTLIHLNNTNDVNVELFQDLNELIHELGKFYENNSYDLNKYESFVNEVTVEWNSFLHSFHITIGDFSNEIKIDVKEQMSNSFNLLKQHIKNLIFEVRQDY